MNINYVDSRTPEEREADSKIETTVTTAGAMTNTEKRLEEIKQIVYGNARKGAVTDDLKQIIGLRTGEGLEFENLAKGLTGYVEDEITQALAEERERMRGEIEETFGGCACGFHGYLVLPNCETNDHDPEKCARCILNFT